jgi:hypothetical protein
MSCYFVLRSPYLPSNRWVKKLDAASPLAWFQDLWMHLQAHASLTCSDVLGIEHVYGFSGFADKVRSGAVPVPLNDDELQQSLSSHWYANNVEARDGLVLLETDDDEVELAFWWMSEAVLLGHAEQFSIYAVDRLPDGASNGGFEPETEMVSIDGGPGDGAVYAAFSTVWDGANLSDLPGPVEIAGVRLPELVARLAGVAPDAEHLLEIDWLALVARGNPELGAAALLRRVGEVSPSTASDNYEAIHAGSMSEDDLRANVQWLLTRERSPASVEGGEHHVELRLDDGFNHHVWIFFDDLWASSHPALARSILRFAAPPDVAFQPNLSQRNAPSR